MGIGTTLVLRRAIWNADVRRSILNKSLTEAARTLEQKLRDNIDQSTPAGRLYSRGHITARRTASNKNLRAKRGTKTRVIVAPRVFRASAEGQPPARRTSRLYNSLKVSRVPSKLEILARVTAPGASILDNPEKLNRPFFRSVVSPFRREEFNPLIRSSIKSLLA